MPNFGRQTFTPLHCKKEQQPTNKHGVNLLAIVICFHRRKEGICLPGNSIQFQFKDIDRTKCKTHVGKYLEIVFLIAFSEHSVHS